MEVTQCPGGAAMLLCTGGCRSGKSEFARVWAEARGKRRVYLATAYAGDEEMARRIARHQAVRGPGWATFEVARARWEEPGTWLPEAASMGEVLLFDCLTLWTSLCLERGYGEDEVLAVTDRLLSALANCGKPVALVTNELGMGLVPDNALGRLFRDVAGLVNQKAAAAAGAVVLLVAGQPLYVKGAP